MDILDEMAAIEAASTSGLGKAVRKVVPSPRGIQDFLLEFPTLPEADHDKGNPPASVYPSHSYEQKKRPATDTQHAPYLPVLPHPSDAPSPSNGSTSGYPFAFSPPPVIVPPSSYGEDLITPWLDEHSPRPDRENEVFVTKEDVGVKTHERPALTRKSLMIETETEKKSAGSCRSSAPTYGFQDVPCKVMPPTAKSILERRERAIREGRRHEAKLNSEERRILRRLRNRESAERCAKRKAEEADLLARNIDELERENARLRSVAAQFESAVLKLEQCLGEKAKSTSDGRVCKTEVCSML